jgi:hypothetical protein
MRAAILHMLVAVLIAVFAIGMPQSVHADCLTCPDCNVASPAKDHIPCSQGTLVCQPGQSCANQMQKMPAQTTIGAAQSSAEAIFGEAATAAIKLAHIPPDTAPPRL